jgi:hypothetical protein
VAKDQRERSAAQAKAAELRAAERRQQQRKRLLIASGLVLAVLAVIAVLVGIGVTRDNNNTSPPAASGSTSPTGATAQILKDITSVPQSTFDAVGAGTASAFPGKANPPGTPASGKPLVLYYGAEFCPFCAAERWPMAVALSRFGTWTSLGITHSSATDEFPNTPTLTFHGATLTSSTLTFRGYETTTNQPQGNSYVPLDTLPAADEQLVASLNPSGTIPFISFDSQYTQSGASYSPQILAGKTQQQIAAALADPNDPLSQAIVGSANVLTAAICATTNQQPSEVCTSAGVKAGAAKLGS